MLSGGLIFVIEADEDSVSVSTDKKKKKKKSREGKRATKLWGREKNMINQRFELSSCSRPSKSRPAGAYGGREDKSEPTGVCRPFLFASRLAHQLIR